MDKLNERAETGCCERFDPAPWDGREIVWQDKLFVQDRVRSFLHIPLNFGQVMVRNMEKIAAADALASESVMVTDENSLWGADVYIAVAKEVPGSKMVRLSGTFLAKVFEGPFKEMGNWMKEMEKFVASKGKKAKRTLFFYTTCPACAKHYGKNYVVLLAE
ncbi:MAG: hydrolase, partial [Patescibacteria group bacterium]